MSLAPDHLADLRASGLNDDTIAALQCESERPHSLRKFPGGHVGLQNSLTGIWTAPKMGLSG